MFPTLFGTFGSRRSKVATDRSESASMAAQGAAAVGRDDLSLENVRVVIEDGLLMVLGPEGDPVPPEAFRGLVSAETEGGVTLDGYGEVPAARILAVLQAQTDGVLAAGERTDGWVLAMLGIGPQPEMAAIEELQAEREAAKQEGRVGQTGEVQRETPGGGLLSPIPLAIVPPCPEGLEHSDVTVIALSGLPDGSVLSAGSDEGHGRWLLSPTALDELLVQLPHDCPQSVLVKVTAIAITGQRGDLASAQADLRVDCKTVSRPSEADRELTPSAPRSVSIDLDPELLSDPANDVLLIRGVPADMSLSAGIHDDSINGWILRPTDAAGLRMEAAAGSTRHLTLTVMGICLAEGASRQARVLVRLPIALD